MVDNVPAFVAEAVPGITKNLVILTCPYPASITGRQGSRLYVGPSQPTPVDRWDYTRPERVDATVTMGQRESDHYLPLLDAFLKQP